MENSAFLKRFLEIFLFCTAFTITTSTVAGAVDFRSGLKFFSQDKPYSLMVEPDYVAVAFRETFAESTLTVLVNGQEMTLTHATPFGPGYLNIFLLSVPLGVEIEKYQDLITALNTLEAVDYATPYLVRGHLGSPYIPTKYILTRVKDGVTEEKVKTVGDGYHLEFLGAFGVSPRQYRFAVTPKTQQNVLEAATALHENPMFEWAHPDFIHIRETRDTPNDPQYVNQWHLNNTGQGGGVAGNDVKAPAAWNITTGNASIKICIIDTGVQINHPDLAAHILPGYDVLDQDTDPSPRFDSHGTSCAGVAAAVSNNGVGVAGIARNCSIIPIRLIDAPNTEAQEAEAFDWAYTFQADIISNSWGPPDGHGTVDPLPDVVRTAIDTNTDNGRGGRGAVIFWAAGNGHPTDTCDQDGYASYSKVISVGASTNAGVRSSYSEKCTSIDVSAPSSGGTLGITTTTWNSNYTSSFGGTSSASPLAAGVGALLLSRNADLNRTQVYNLLTSTADKIDQAGGAWSNGFSTSYGYGRVNAYNALLAVPLPGPTWTPTITPSPSPTPVPYTLPFTDGFEGGSTPWTAKGVVVWERGAPSSGPNAAHTGSNVWATNLSGNYGVDGANSYLDSPGISLAGAASPRMSFWHWYQFEGSDRDWDGGKVQISTDWGQTFTDITPLTGYDSQDVVALNDTPGFSYKANPSWAQELFDLTSYTGQIVIIRFWFASDYAVNNFPGWYLDDFSVADAVTPTPTLTPTFTPPPTSTPTTTPTPTPPPTFTPTLTQTPPPTSTPVPTDTPLPTNTSTPSPTVTAPPTSTQAPTMTPTFSPLPTATPLPGRNPQIYLGGFFNTQVTARYGGQVKIVVFGISPEGDPITSSTLTWNGVDGGSLLDDGAHADFNSGDGWWGITGLYGPGMTKGRYLFGVRVEDAAGRRSDTWPWLEVQ